MSQLDTIHKSTFYTICAAFPEKREDYNIVGILKEGVQQIASAYENRVNSFTLSGKRYILKDIKEFRIFEYESKEDYYKKLNADEQAKKEMYFDKEHFVCFKWHTLSRFFKEATTDFIKGFAIVGDSSATTQLHYVSLVRIEELRSCPKTKFDLSRLTRLCQEINESYASGCLIATISLLRAIFIILP
jgi:hypothetical protein